MTDENLRTAADIFQQLQGEHLLVIVVAFSIYLLYRYGSKKQAAVLAKATATAPAQPVSIITNEMIMTSIREMRKEVQAMNTKLAVIDEKVDTLEGSVATLSGRVDTLFQSGRAN